MTMILRDARRDDVPAIVGMLADDDLGRARDRLEDPLPQAYYDAYDEIAADPNNRLLVAEIDGEIVGTMQLSFLRMLGRQGSTRAEVESGAGRKPSARQGPGTADDGSGDRHRTGAQLRLHAACEQQEPHECTPISTNNSALSPPTSA